MFIFKPEPLLNYDGYCFYESAFSDEECDKIIAIGKAIGTSPGVVGGNDGGKLEEKVRRSNVGWINYSAEHDWLFQKMYHYAMDANNARYGFDLHGYLEPLQYTEYQNDGHYSWHQDSGIGKFSVRKLSQVVLLSDEKDYEGGDLEFFMSKREVPIRKRGTLVCFPAFEVHRVAPVTSGERKSLVAWITGHPFR